MITRITGVLEGVEGLEAIVRVEGGLAYQVLVPAFQGQRLKEKIGQPVTLHTHQYLEGQGQGSSFIPRLIGFASPQDRRFFDLLTSVDGLGNRKALRALAQEPALIARAIVGADTGWLSKLPEIGKKTAEKVILELKTKVQPFLTEEEVRGLDAAAAGAEAPMGEASEEAIAALVALGETRPDAERMVRRALGRNGSLATSEEILAAAFGGG